MLTPAKAYEIASQWGSLITAGDPGAVFYTFPINDARPQSEEHRQQCLDYTFDLIKEQRDDTPEEDLDAETVANVAELRALWDFFSTSPLGDGTDKPIARNEFTLDTSGAHGAWADLDAFTQGYIEALFFTESSPAWDKAAIAADPKGWEDAEREGVSEGSIPGDVGFADLAPETLADIIENCAKFQDANGRHIEGAQNVSESKEQDWKVTECQAGRDFWYTRNGHGCGFWDGDWPEPYASELTAAAKAFGEVNAYLGDDGKVYLS